MKSVLPGSVALTATAAVLLLVSGSAHAQTFTNIVVNGTTNLYGAGRTGSAATPAPGGPGGGGTDPITTTFALNSGIGRILTFSSVTGSVIYNTGGGDTATNPDGSENTNTLSTSGFQGISGITFTNRAGFLTGVFINGTPSGADGTVGSPPASLSYPALSPDALSYSPLLNQAFFIGDGRTGTNNASGTIQQFLVPDGATTLVLGFEDAPNYTGLPGAYSDNSGSYTASFNVSGVAVPEPGTLPLMLLTLALFAGGVIYKRRSTVAARA